MTTPRNRGELSTPIASPRSVPAGSEKIQLERELADRDDLIRKLQAENDELRQKTEDDAGVVFLSIPLGK